MAASLEVCNIEDDFATILAGHNDDVWGRILRLSSKTSASKRKSLEAPKQDTPHHWQEYSKHAALSNLLSIAVSHKDLQLRKSYIERIMTLSPMTQRLLMSMIEKRKKSNSRKKTPSKHRQLRSASSIKKRENEEIFDKHVQESTKKVLVGQWLCRHTEARLLLLLGHRIGLQNQQVLTGIVCLLQLILADR